MKKFLFIVLSSMLVINLIGCSSKDKATGEDLKDKPKVESADGKDKKQEELKFDEELDKLNVDKKSYKDGLKELAKLNKIAKKYELYSGSGVEMRGYQNLSVIEKEFADKDKSIEVSYSYGLSDDKTRFIKEIWVKCLMPSKNYDINSNKIFIDIIEELVGSDYDLKKLSEDYKVLVEKSPHYMDTLTTNKGKKLGTWNFEKMEVDTSSDIGKDKVKFIYNIQGGDLSLR